MNIVVKLTNACNFACTYCSVGDSAEIKTLDLITFKKMIDDLPELLEELGDKNVSFIWHGGEPLLLSPNFYCEAMDYTLEKLKSYTVSFKMQTNGYLINSEWVNLFKKYQIDPGISLDGYQELHDKNRTTKTGQTTFATIMQNIQSLRDAGLSVSVLMVLNNHEPVDADKLFDFITQNSLSCKIHCVYPSGRAENREDISAVYQSYIELMKTLYQKIMESDIEISIDPLTDMVQAVLSGQSMNECSYAGTCGKDFMCLFEDGGVSFCGRHANDFGLSYGNIHDKSILELYNSENAEKIRSRQVILKKTPCASCDDYNLCHGGCAFEAALVNGDINTAYPQCKGWRELIHFVKTMGLVLLKSRLLREKQNHQNNIETNSMLLGVLKQDEL